MRNWVRLAVLPMVAMGVISVAHAGSDTTSFQVKITITESCDIKSTAATDVDFLSHVRSSASNSLDATGNLSVTCSKGTPYAIALDMGKNPVPGATSDVNRRMVLANNYVPYGLYRDAGRTQLWGNVAGAGGDTLTGTGSAAAQSIPVYGRVQAGAINVPAGTYVDTVQATISY